ncbi:MAG: beta-galactosidase trimerization domain-containing protein [Eubacteriales bacterium]|nr:beta-galactosidase trimerization domain-containing protein [Eubacteriales bacterium]MDD4717916.1 beta-galactosidase trimerization domain-containing protein [Eubacteriales bacterium]
MNYRQVHLDFHTSEAIEKIGDKFTKENFQAALITGHVNSITVFAKCHHGWMYYPSDEFPMHPGLSYDLLAAQIDAASEIDVKTPVYISAGLDERLAKENTGWLRRDIDGKTTWASDFDTPGYHVFCFNSPYMEILLRQVIEVTGKYKPEKIFMDITSAEPCYCSYCRKLMDDKGVSIYNEEAVREIALETYNNYTRKVRDAVDLIDPDIGIYHNGGHVTRGSRNDLSGISHIEIESLPTGAWGYDNLPMTAAYVRNLPYDYLAMTGKFHTWWGEFGGYKHPNALKYETSLMLSFGAKCSIGDQLHPSGEMDAATYKLIGETYNEVEEKEQWSEHTGFVSDVAVFPCETFGDRKQSNSIDAGVTRMFLENKVLFDFVDMDTELGKYKLVVLPDAIVMSPELQNKLSDYLNAGGKILASGKSCLDKTDNIFVFDFGGEYVGPCPYSPAYLRPGFDLKSLDKADFVVYSEVQTVKGEGNNSLAKIRHPYFNRTAEHFCSHQHTPVVQQDVSDGIITGRHGCYIAYPIFSEYFSKASIMNKQIIDRLLEFLLGDDVSVITNLPAQGVVTVMENTDRRQYIVHIVYGSPVRRGGIEVIEDLIPLHDIYIGLRLPNIVRKVFLPRSLSQEYLPFPFSYENERLWIRELTVDCHRIIVLEY